jgi:hypothetical protein
MKRKNINIIIRKIKVMMKWRISYPVLSTLHNDVQVAFRLTRLTIIDSKASQSPAFGSQRSLGSPAAYSPLLGRSELTSVILELKTGHFVATPPDLVSLCQRKSDNGSHLAHSSAASSHPPSQLKEIIDGILCGRYAPSITTGIGSSKTTRGTTLFKRTNWSWLSAWAVRKWGAEGQIHSF